MEDDGIDERAQRLYEAYVASMGRNGVGIDEEWDDLEDTEQEAWRDVARCAAGVV